MRTIQDKAESIARRGAASGRYLAAFPIAVITPIITTAIQLLMKCWQPDDAKSMAKYVNDRRNPADGSYNRRLMRRTVNAVEHAAEEHGQQLTRQQSEELAFETLEEARNATEDESERVVRESGVTP